MLEAIHLEMPRMVGHRSRRDWQEMGFGGAVPNQRHRRGGAGARVDGFDAHGVGHLLAVTVPFEVEFGWDAGGFEVGVSCDRVPIRAGATTFTRAVDR